jgi:CheY-like chemotaxis protein
MKGEALNILLVEDNPDHAELVRRSFQIHRVANQIYHAWDGEEALDFLLRRGRYKDPQSSPRPHVVLLDLRLPRIDGLEVLQEIKSRDELRAIPVVVLTTSESEKDVDQAYELYANSYLVKPVDFDNFTDMMRDLGFYWLAWNHLPWSESLPEENLPL